MGIFADVKSRSWLKIESITSSKLNMNDVIDINATLAAYLQRYLLTNLF